MIHKIVGISGVARHLKIKVSGKHGIKVETRILKFMFEIRTRDYNLPLWFLYNGFMV